MRCICCLLFIGITFLLLGSCQSDRTVVPVEIAEFPVGEYEGLYIVVTIDSLDNKIELSQPCQVTFWENGRWLFDLPESAPESTRIFCDGEGEYEVVDAGLSVYLSDSNFTRGTCRADWPHGMMEFERKGDSLILFREDYSALFDYTWQKWLRLKRL